MGTLWSELGPVADAVTDRPRREHDVALAADAGHAVGVGALGRALEDGGISRAVIANADGGSRFSTFPEYQRLAATALMAFESLRRRRCGTEVSSIWTKCGVGFNPHDRWYEWDRCD